jgi:hypothetical protein
VRLELIGLQRWGKSVFVPSASSTCFSEGMPKPPRPEPPLPYFQSPLPSPLHQPTQLNPQSPSAGVRLGEAANPGPVVGEDLEALRSTLGVEVVELPREHSGLLELYSVRTPDGG